MATQVIVSQAGPLSIKVPFSAPSDGPAALLVAGSVWTQNANTMIGIMVILDGQNIGTAQVFANPTATHMNVVPIVIPVTLSQGNHVLQLAPSNTYTVSDQNDGYTVALMY
jgi:hypothetical protein